jgi:serine phosphatase RsbU (regulator of sigma subunit)
MILKFREEQQKKTQEFLQKSLDERTREVVEQKERIETINKDLTDSIRYAESIQSSLLPAIGTLTNRFADAFVYFAPRDIVSGDFYWFDELRDGNFLAVGADCTGHGVPGGFMSMIGITLIKDICNTILIKDPAELLFQLDRELTHALSQNVETVTSSDGMDMVAAVIDPKNRMVRVASAINSYIVYTQGQQQYCRGSKNTVGGHYNPEGKIFETQNFELELGDKLYMYSDGYADQFGGPEAKKFKTSGVRKMLDEIQHMPMFDQHDYLKNNFEEWKKGHEQVDDVLFLGIQL